MMPILHLPGEITPGQFGPIRRASSCLQKLQTFTMSMAGMPSVMQTTSGTPASAASMMASAANGGGTKITRGVGAGLPHRLLHRVEYGPFEVRRAALARRDAAHHLRAVGNRLLGVERAFLAGEALHQQARILI